MIIIRICSSLNKLLQNIVVGINWIFGSLFDQDSYVEAPMLKCDSKRRWDLGGMIKFRWGYQSRGHRWVQWPYKQQQQLRALLLPCEYRKKARWEVSSPQHQVIYFSKVMMEKQTSIDSFGLCYFIAIAWDDKEKCLRQESSITQEYLGEKDKQTELGIAISSISGQLWVAEVGWHQRLSFRYLAVVWQRTT